VFGGAEVPAGPSVEEVSDVDHEAPERNRNRLPAASSVVQHLFGAQRATSAEPSPAGEGPRLLLKSSSARHD
jgi:hypothetical protein